MAKALMAGADGIIIDPETGEKIDLQQLKNNAINKKEENLSGANIEKSNEPVKNISHSVVEKPRVYTKFEVRPDSYFYVKFGTFFNEDRVTVIHEEAVDLEKNSELHWVKFRMWTYGEELDWKNQATEYDSIKRVHSMNTEKLNEIKLRHLLIDWSFSEKEISLKLLHVNKILSDESLKTVYSLYPNVVRYIVDRMNEILESNC